MSCKHVISMWPVPGKKCGRMHVTYAWRLSAGQSKRHVRQGLVDKESSHWKYSIDYISAGVTDGVSVGHPCCSVQDCSEPLSNHLKRYCESHSKKNNLCVILGCWEKSETGYQTCRQESHRAAEHSQKLRGKAMFQPRKRLEHAGLAGKSLFYRIHYTTNTS